MADVVTQVGRYLRPVLVVCDFIVTVISTTFNVLFWFMTAFIILSIVVDIALYGWRNFASRFGLLPRPQKAVVDGINHPNADDSSKKDR
ncbi:hypothetical protein B0H66DRAFT_604414 [Apodospora peruviana]|uniref:Uncharacterized protein n=1 Tax=Apodospora peruviana TaxID=516989 RepID=A0AAE0I035_9PEZI|nr:hypothetical protein B0H66DRAFT_604414 [Apodospora peruviana]